MKLNSLLYCFFFLFFFSCINEQRTKISGDVDEVVKVIVSDILLTDKNITISTNLRSDLGADELDLVEITMELEYQYNISISDYDMEGFNTVNDIVRYIENDRK